MMVVAVSLTHPTLPWAWTWTLLLTSTKGTGQSHHTKLYPNIETGAALYFCCGLLVVINLIVNTTTKLKDHCTCCHQIHQLKFIAPRVWCPPKLLTTTIRWISADDGVYREREKRLASKVCLCLMADDRSFVVKRQLLLEYESILFPHYISTPQLTALLGQVPSDTSNSYVLNPNETNLKTSSNWTPPIIVCNRPQFLFENVILNGHFFRCNVCPEFFPC